MWSEVEENNEIVVFVEIILKTYLFLCSFSLYVSATQVSVA